MRLLKRTAVAALLSLVLAAPGLQAGSSHSFQITDYGAKGDGSSLDTEAINKAIGACGDAGGGLVEFPAGKYLSGTIRLRSHVHLQLSAGAMLVGTTNLADYQAPNIPSFMPEARWGKWHRALLVGDNVEDVSITGPGIINGNKVFDPTGEEKMRGPHTVVFVGCRNFTFNNLEIVDAANYAIFFQASDNVEVRNVKIVGGWDGVHFRGAPNRWCKSIKILNSQFYTGDDSIAGRYWDNVVIAGCILNSSCNGIRLIGPATNLMVDRCLFYGPGEQSHRSSGRNNMLSGIILQPGAWDRTEGLLDNVLLSANTMRNVASPVTLWTKPGNPVGTVTITGLEATDVYRSAISFESWADAPITNVVLRSSVFEFAGGQRPTTNGFQVKGPGVDARSLPAWGIYVRNVEHVTVQDVRLVTKTADFRPVILADRVSKLMLDDTRYPVVEGAKAVVTNDVGTLEELRQHGAAK